MPAGGILLTKNVRNNRVPPPRQLQHNSESLSHKPVQQTQNLRIPYPPHP